MEMKNSLATKQQNTAVVEYDSNGETVRLGPGMIKQYLVSGGGSVNDQEVMMFLNLCRFQHLNPFLREAYLIKYGQNSPATMVVGKDVFLKRAQRNPKFDGLQSGVIVLNQNGQIVEREGTFYLEQTEELVGGWAKVWIKGARTPFYEAVKLSEYIGRKKSGEVTEQWSKRPATMIRKVALSHALKEAFPDELGGLYAQEEMGDASDIVLDDAPVIMPQEEEPVPVYEDDTVVRLADQAYQPAPPAMDPASALFGN